MMMSILQMSITAGFLIVAIVILRAVALNAGLDSGMWLLAVLILSLCGLFSMEYKTGMYKVLNGTTHGHTDTVRMKLLLSGGFAVVAFVFASLPQLIYIGRFFGFSGLTFPLASIPPTSIGAFPAFMGALPIWAYLAFMLFMRLLTFWGVALIALALSMKVRNNAYTALLAAGILLLPLFLHQFGLSLLNPLSVIELVTINPLVVAPSIIGAVQVVVFIGITTICGLFLSKRFGRT